MGFGHVTALVPTVAAVGAIFLAYLTVRQARSAGAEARRDRRARRAERAMEIVAQIRVDNRNGPNTEGIELGKDKLRAILVTLGSELPLTRELVAANFRPETCAENELLANDVLVELGQAAAFPTD